MYLLCFEAQIQKGTLSFILLCQVLQLNTDYKHETTVSLGLSAQLHIILLSYKTIVRVKQIYSTYKYFIGYILNITVKYSARICRNEKIFRKSSNNQIGRAGCHGSETVTVRNILAWTHPDDIFLFNSKLSSYLKQLWSFFSFILQRVREHFIFFGVPSFKVSQDTEPPQQT